MKPWAAVVCLGLMLLGGCGGGSNSGDNGGGNSNSWRYTALGDSLAVGILDSQGGYVRRYRNDIVTLKRAISNFLLYPRVPTCVVISYTNRNVLDKAHLLTQDARPGLPLQPEAQVISLVHPFRIACR